jgi:membrane fusion protein (multidrug efflux system)
MRKLAVFLISLLLASPALLAKPKALPASTIPPVFVEAAPVQLQEWQEQVQATGILAAEQAVIVKPEISGKVDKIFFRSGQTVKANTPLIQLSASDAKARLAYAEAQANLSRANYQRAKELVPSGVLSKADFDQVKATNQANQANVAQAQAAVSKALIRAPFTGRLGLRLINLGDYVTPGQDLVELQAQDQLRVDFSIPETYLAKAAIDQTVLLQVSGLSQQSFTGKVYALAAGIDVNTHSLAMRASIPNPKHLLMPGSFAKISLLLGQPHQVLSIPQLAVNNSEEGAYVYRIIKQQAVKTPVTVGEQYQDRIAITQGLQNGDLVVTAGQLKLQDGAPVMLANSTPSSAPNSIHR